MIENKVNLFKRVLKCENFTLTVTVENKHSLLKKKMYERTILIKYNQNMLSRHGHFSCKTQLR